MARVFSIQTLLRQTSNTLLRELLDRLGHADLAIPWTELGERDIEPIHHALKTLTSARFDEIEGLFRTLFDLASTPGIGAVREAARSLDCEADLADMPLEEGAYDSVVWTWLRREEVVEFAGLIHRVENLSWWRRRTDFPKRDPDTSPVALERLGRALSALLDSEQGRGRHCTVEPLLRTGTWYYFAYPDDYVQNVTSHDDEGRLTPRTFRQTFSIVFAFDPAEGALELYAGRLAARLKQEIEAVFARVVFEFELGLWKRPTYELDRLKYRAMPLVTDAADRIEVSIRELRFTIRGTLRKLALKADPDRGGSDIYDMIEEVINHERVPLSALEVDLATFSFEFLDAPRRAGGS